MVIMDSTRDVQKGSGGSGHSVCDWRRNVQLTVDEDMVYSYRNRAEGVDKVDAGRSTADGGQGFYFRSAEGVGDEIRVGRLANGLHLSIAQRGG